MLKFQDKLLTPPSGAYPYRRSESGMSFRQVAFADLVKEVRDHCKANGFPIGPNFEAEVEDNSCRQLLSTYPNFEGCVGEDGSRPYTEGRKWHLADVRAFLNTMGRLATSDDKFVNQEEAERRAEICARCPQNIQMPECLACGGVTALVRTIKGNRHTSRDNDLKICGACGCDIQTKCHISRDIQMRDDVTWDSACWMKDD